MTITNDDYPNNKSVETALLTELLKYGGQAKASQMITALADVFNLSVDQKTRRYDSESHDEVIWPIRVLSARKSLMKKGELENPIKGVWRVTVRGETRVLGTTATERVVQSAKKVLDTEVELSRRPPSKPLVSPVPPPVKLLLEMAKRTRNILLYGPPGTGKTWLVTQFAKAFTDANKVEMVTFHQSFAYEEFVEGIKPVIADHGQVAYGVIDGVFKRICKSAEADPNGKYLLIIDEINRANIAKVLGELITLIEDDKRLGQPNEVQVALPYSGMKFGVPANLTILGTMNTADRSIALLDLALRRRFTFVEMPPDPTLLSTNVAGVNMQALLGRLNRRIAALLDPNHCIGHSYLMGIDTEDDLHFAWYHRVVPLLQEYFYHDGERLQAVIGKAFVEEVTLDAETQEALGTAYEDMPRYEVVKLLGEEFLAAMQNIAW